MLEVQVMVQYKTGKPLEQVPESLTLDQVWYTYMRHGIPVRLIQTSNIISGGFGIGLGIGLAVATPLGNIALGEGNSVSVGKK